MAATRRTTRRRRFLLVLLVLVSLTILTIDYRSSTPVEKLRSAAGTVFGPFRTGANTVFRPIGNVFHYDDEKRKADKLRRRIQELEGERYRAKIDEQQYRQLLEAAHITYIKDLHHLTAQVVAGPINNFSQTVEINRGAGDGIRTGMPVVTPNGLVGKIKQVEGNRSLVELITNPDSTFDLGILVSKNEPLVSGLAHGTGKARPLRMDGIDPDRVPKGKIKRGDLLATSGITTSVYPGDIPVGKVLSVHPSSDGSQLVVDLKPTANLGNLSYVSVLLWEPTN